MNQKLRISGYKDYVAVDLINNDDKIHSTPFYLKINESKDLKYKDQEEGRWIKTTVRIKDDFSCLKCKDIEGMEWESSFEELIDNDCIRFY